LSASLLSRPSAEQLAVLRARERRADALFVALVALCTGLYLASGFWSAS
jgi:cytochrome c-type biogenesis protein CcmH/NrfG